MSSSIDVDMVHYTDLFSYAFLIVSSLYWNYRSFVLFVTQNKM